MASSLESAQAALAQGEWETARDLFGEALEEDAADPDALEGMGWAAWWIGDPDQTISAREQAFRLYLERGESDKAAGIGALLAADHREFHGETSIGRGWLERSRRLLEGAPESQDLGMLMLLEADFALLEDRDPQRAVELCDQAADMGRRLGVADLEAIGRAQLGTALVSLGRTEEGMRSLDEALAIATNEPLSYPFTLGWSTCCMIGACERVGDFRRATEWCTKAREFVARWGGRQLLGVCRSSYGNVLATWGDWESAEDELVGAVEDLQASRPGMAAGSLARLAELRRRQGRTEEALELLEQAGPEGIVGRGELSLAAGDCETAAELASRTLRRIPNEALLVRLPGLELLARAEGARGRIEQASAAVAELEQAMTDAATPFVKARVRLARGRLELDSGREESAREAFEDAIDCFEEASAPYEQARARLGLGEALAALGRSEHAERERAAAAKAFEQLGATADAARAGGDTNGQSGLGELTPRELEILRLVAAGKSDAEIAEELVLSPHTVHRHVANVRTKLGLGSRAAAVAWAGKAGLL